MANLRKNKGFTLIEFLVTLAIATMLIGLSTPFITSLKVDISLQKTLRKAKFEIISTMNYALAGKSFGGITGVRSEIPAAYGLYIRSGEYGLQPGYKYIEFEKKDELYSVMYEQEKSFDSPSTFLSQIELEEDDDSKKSIDEVLIFVEPPLGEVYFLEMPTLNPFLLEKVNDQQIQLYFQYKNNPNSRQIIGFDQQKNFSISNY